MGLVPVGKKTSYGKKVLWYEGAIDNHGSGFPYAPTGNGTETNVIQDGDNAVTKWATAGTQTTTLPG